MKRLTLAQSCCTTSSAIWYWAGMFLLLYGLGILLGIIWPAVRQFGHTLILAALGAACFLNFAARAKSHAPSCTEMAPSSCWRLASQR